MGIELLEQLHEKSLDVKRDYEKYMETVQKSDGLNEIYNLKDDDNYQASWCEVDNPEAEEIDKLEADEKLE